MTSQFLPMRLLLVSLILAEPGVGKDLPSVRKKIIENVVRDFSPDVKDDVVKILDSWERIGSMGSEEKLMEILGQDRAT